MRVTVPDFPIKKKCRVMDRLVDDRFVDGNMILFSPKRHGIKDKNELD